MKVEIVLKQFFQVLMKIATLISVLYKYYYIIIIIIIITIIIKTVV